MILTVATGAFWLNPHILGTLHDDGVYVSTAKALAEGRGYRVISVPNEPLQTKYPILYPLILAIAWKLWPSFPDNIIALKGIGLLCAGATVGLTYLYLIRFRYFSRNTAAWACALCATTPYFLIFAAHAISCPLFALLVICALWSLDSLSERASPGWRHSVLSGIVIGLPFLARSIGIVLAIPVLAAKVNSRRDALWVAFGIALVWLPWILWVVWALQGGQLDPITKYQTDYMGLNGTLDGGPNFSFWWSASSRPYVPNMLIQNLTFAILSGAALPLGGLTSVLGMWDQRLFIVVAAAGLVTWWTVARGLASGAVLSWFLLAYALVLCAWPWKSTRFFMPVLPLLAPFLIAGMSRVCQSVLTRRHVSVIASTVIGAALILNVAVSTGWKSVAVPTVGGTRQEILDLWPSMLAALEWLKAHSRPEDVVAASDDPLVYLYTSRKAIRPFVYQPASLFYGANSGATGTVSDFVAYVTPYRPRYLFYYPAFLGAADFAALVESVIDRYPGWLVPVFRPADPRVLVYEFDWRHGPAGQQ